jgi:hypothetical protein
VSDGGTDAPAAGQKIEEAETMVDAPAIATREDGLGARRALLEKEKPHLRAGDALAAERKALPWVRIEAPYRFETEDGPRNLADPFGGRSQLVVYHFMFGPDWEQGCDGCSFLADHFDGANLHLKHHDVTLVAVSRAPVATFLPYKRRMGWHFAWVSSHSSDFNASPASSPPAGRAPSTGGRPSGGSTTSGDCGSACSATGCCSGRPGGSRSGWTGRTPPPPNTWR